MPFTFLVAATYNINAQHAQALSPSAARLAVSLLPLNHRQAPLMLPIRSQVGSLYVSHKPIQKRGRSLSNARAWSDKLMATSSSRSILAPTTGGMLTILLVLLVLPSKQLSLTK